MLEAQATYLEQYDAITQKWIEATRVGGSMPDRYIFDDDLNVILDPDMTAKFEASQVYWQCRTDRQELNKRIRQQLRHILSDEQEAAVGLVDDKDDGNP